MQRRLRDRSMRTDHGKSGQSFSVVNLGSLGNLRTSPCVKKDMAVRIIVGLLKAKVRLGTRNQRRDQEAGVEVNCSLSQPYGRDPSRHVRDGLARPNPRPLLRSDGHFSAVVPALAGFALPVGSPAAPVPVPPAAGVRTSTSRNDMPAAPDHQPSADQANRCILWSVSPKAAGMAIPFHCESGSRSHALAYLVALARLELASPIVRRRTAFGVSSRATPFSSMHLLVASRGRPCCAVIAECDARPSE